MSSNCRPLNCTMVNWATVCFISTVFSDVGSDQSRFCYLSAVQRSVILGNHTVGESFQGVFKQTTICWQTKLGHRSAEQGTFWMDAVKMKVVRDWPQPNSVKEVQYFLGFANFYRLFIRWFSSMVAPLTALTKNSVSVWILWWERHRGPKGALVNRFWWPTIEPDIRLWQWSFVSTCTVYQGI